jgi:hypothetical protein
MTEQERDTGALDRLVEEARSEGAPALDWDAIEASLMKRVAETPRARAPNRARTFTAVLAAAALLSIGGFLVVRSHEVLPDAARRAPVAEREAPRVRRTVNGDELAPGAVVTSGAEPVVVEHRGHVTWTLSPESTAHVESVGDVVSLAVDRGQVSAEVVKSRKSESFVVRVERTRVAVHGTRFRVTRLSDSVRVEVDEGIVGVGPVGRAGFDLRAPDAATLTFDGVRTDVTATTGNVQSPAASAAKQGSRSTRPKTAYFAPIEPDGLPRGALAGVEQVVSSVERCLRENTVSADDLRVSVETRLTLRVDPKGTVGEAVFAPPLAPNVGTCVDEAIATIGFPRSAGGFVAYRVLELGH